MLCIMYLNVIQKTTVNIKCILIDWSITEVFSFANITEHIPVSIKNGVQMASSKLTRFQIVQSSAAEKCIVPIHYNLKFLSLIAET